MSGHSKWSTIKHKKAAADAKRGQVFTKLIKELTVAARLGGGDPTGNPRLRSPRRQRPRRPTCPPNNIQRAIRKGTGELPGVSYEEVSYEGYGPGGVAIIVETVTDNRMRTTPEIRHVFSKYGGNLGEPNSVAWMFNKRGHFRVAVSAKSEEELMELVLDAGAEDLGRDGEHFDVYSAPDRFHGVQHALEQAGVPTDGAQLIMEPQNTVHLDGKKAAQCIKLLEMLEDQDDVQHVYANLDFDEESLEADAG